MEIGRTTRKNLLIKPLTWVRYRKIVALMRKQEPKEVAYIMGMTVKALYKTIERCTLEDRRKNPRPVHTDRRRKQNVEICRLEDGAEKVTAL